MADQDDNAVPVAVKSRHLPDSAQGAKDYAREKFARLGKFSPRLLSVDVMLQPDGDAWKCEATLHMDRSDPLIVHASAGDLNSAADSALDKAERQLIREKEKEKEGRISERRKSKSSGRFGV